MIKAAAALVVAVCVAIGAVPFLVASGGGAGDLTSCNPTAGAGGEMSVILDTIRSVESGGNYTVTIRTSSASGAYAFIDSAWRNLAAQAGVDTGRYPRAYMAPPADQDAVATLYVNQILAEYGDIAYIPLAWYLPSAIGNPAKMDVIPPMGGNVLTPREYQTKWLRNYHEKVAAAGIAPTAASTPTTGTADPTATIPPTTTGGAGFGCRSGTGPRNAITADGRWSLPAPRDAVAEGTLDDPHHHYPAWDLMLPEGTPIYAITGGTVVTVQHWDGNWWRNGCNSSRPPAGCNTCGHGLSIQTADGLRHIYCHNQRLHVTRGDVVAAGQHIADSGDTGRSGGPHLHLELKINDLRRCPLPLMAAIWHGTPIPDPASLPTAGCSFIP